MSTDLAVQGPLLLVVAVGALAVAPFVVWYVARHPYVGCAAIVVGVPLTAGLGRGTIIPFFRVNEVLAVLVAGALVLNRIVDRRRRPLGAMDLPIAIFVFGVVAIPALVLLVRPIEIEADTWRVVFGPLEFLVIYLIVSRSEFTPEQRLRLVRLAMGVSVVVAVAGFLQAADLLGVRGFLEAYYPRTGPVPGICEFGVCRPTSFLEHWSAFGAYALLHYALALGLDSTPGVPLSRRWTSGVAAINGVAVMASQTQAAVIGLVLVTIVLVVYRRRVPPAFGVVGVGVLAGTVVFWTQISTRLMQQVETSLVPESMATRARYWSELFVPIALDHVWFGNGTVISTEVPERLVNFVDSEYLRMVFRAGIGGVALLLMLLVALLHTGLRSRSHADPVVRGLGAALVADTVALAVMGLTAEYLSFSGVSESLWIVVGLVSAALARHPAAVPAATAVAPWRGVGGSSAVPR